MRKSLWTTDDIIHQTPRRRPGMDIKYAHSMDFIALRCPAPLTRRNAPWKPNIPGLRKNLTRTQRVWYIMCYTALVRRVKDAFKFASFWTISSNFFGDKTKPGCWNIRVLTVKRACLSTVLRTQAALGRLRPQCVRFQVFPFWTIFYHLPSAATRTLYRTERAIATKTEEMLGKIAHVADYEGRSVNSHVLVLIRDSISQHENRHGKIGNGISPDENVKPARKTWPRVWYNEKKRLVRGIERVQSAERI